jgi:hypothetical protein
MLTVKTLRLVWKSRSVGKMEMQMKKLRSAGKRKISGGHDDGEEDEVSRVVAPPPQPPPPLLPSCPY